MRIISGKYKGRRLASFEAKHLRPTTDRVKESLFNQLNHEVQGARVLDLFAGTGSLGFESLSRGASEVTFVELSSKSLAILRKNLQLLERADQKVVTVIKGDVFKFVRTWKGKAFDLIFVDPPFTEKLAHLVMESIAASNILHPGGILIIESGQHEPIGDEYPPYNILDRRSFGDKTLSFFVVAQDENSSSPIEEAKTDEL